MKEEENAQNAYDSLAKLDDALILFGYWLNIYTDQYLLLALFM